MSVPRFAVLSLIWLSGCASRDGTESAEASVGNSGETPIRARTRTAGVQEAAIGSTGEPAPARQQEAPLVKLEREADGVLRAHCVACHPWTAASVVTATAACSGKGGRLVVPGDVGRSPLYGKVAGAAICGGPMPPAGALPPAAVAALRAWIEGGAPVGGIKSRVPSPEAIRVVAEQLEVDAFGRDD